VLYLLHCVIRTIDVALINISTCFIRAYCRSFTVSVCLSVCVRMSSHITRNLCTFHRPLHRPLKSMVHSMMTLMRTIISALLLLPSDVTGSDATKPDQTRIFSLVILSTCEKCMEKCFLKLTLLWLGSVVVMALDQ